MNGSPSMPFREAGHVTGDRAFRKFDEIFDDWVTRPPVGNDYGVDAEVEIFDSDGRATGLTFKAQMKGIAKRKNSSDPRVKIKTSTLNYWLSLDVPVLVCLHVVDSGESYARWAHSYDPVVSRSAQAKKSGVEPASTTFSFRPEDRVRLGFRERIRSDVIALRTLRTRVSTGAIPFEVTSEGLDSEYIDEISARLQTALIPVTGAMKLATQGDEKPWGTIHVSKRKIRFGMPVEISSLTVHGEFGDPASDALGDTVADILTAGAVVFANAGMSTQAIALCEQFQYASRLPESPEIAGRLASAYIDQGNCDGAAALICPILISPNESDRIAAEWLLVPLYHFHWEALTSTGLELVKAALTSRAAAERGSGDVEEAARFVYWRAQIEKSSGDRDLVAALASFNEVDGLSESYGEREYFLREKGGVLADLGAWQDAAACYKAAKLISHESDDLDFVLVDALLHSGEYRLALELADVGSVSEDSDFFKAKTVIWRESLRWIVEVVGLDQQWRHQIVPEPQSDSSGRESEAELLVLLRDFDALDPAVVLRYVDALGADADELDALGPVLTVAICTLTNGAFWLLAAHVLQKCQFPENVINSAIAMLLHFDRDNLSRALEFAESILLPDDFKAIRRKVLLCAAEPPRAAPNILRLALPDGNWEEVRMSVWQTMIRPPLWSISSSCARLSRSSGLCSAMTSGPLQVLLAASVRCVRRKSWSDLTWRRAAAAAALLGVGQAKKSTLSRAPGLRCVLGCRSTGQSLTDRLR